MLIQNRDRKLLGAIARYQRHREGRGLLTRLNCAMGKLGHVWWSLLSGCDISREARIDPSTRMPHPTGVVIHAQAVVEPDCLGQHKELPLSPCWRRLFGKIPQRGGTSGIG